VADIFMGGGTTLVEGSRLGMRMFGCDLNPVAWFVVKNEVTPVDLDEVRRLLNEIKAEVSPTSCPTSPATVQVEKRVSGFNAT
jgi:putative DNA methylase